MQAATKTATTTMVDLYLLGWTSTEIAALYGVCGKTILRRLHAAGVELRPKKLPRRRCDYGDCDRDCKHPQNRFCSLEHSRAGSRVHPQPEPRPCELETCGKMFTPEAHKLARNVGGRFCCPEHWNAWRTGRPKSQWRAHSERDQH